MKVLKTDERVGGWQLVSTAAAPGSGANTKHALDGQWEHWCSMSKYVPGLEKKTYKIKTAPPAS